MKFIGITRALAVSSCTDFRFVDEEAKWRGSEVHRIIELEMRGTLDHSSVPKSLRGYEEAHRKFSKETGFIAQHVEKQVESIELGIRGRIDAIGLVKGKGAIVDFKTGTLQPAVALQLCLGGYLHNSCQWWGRYAVRLSADGSYSVKHYPRTTWFSDLQTALAAVRLAKWKLANGLA